MADQLTNIRACKYRYGEGSAAVYIEERGDDTWAISDGFSNVLNSELAWEYEPRPSSRTDEFIARTRHSLDQAKSLLLKAIEKGDVV